MQNILQSVVEGFLVYQNYMGMMWPALPSVLLFLLSMNFVESQGGKVCSIKERAAFEKFLVISAEVTGDMPPGDFADPFLLILNCIAFALMWPIALILSVLALLVGFSLFCERKWGGPGQDHEWAGPCIVGILGWSWMGTIVYGICKVLSA